MLATSLRRMCCFVRYDLSVSWRGLLLQWLVLSLTFALAQVMCFVELWESYPEVENWRRMVRNYTFGYALFSMIILTVYLLFTATLFQYNYRQWQARLGMVMVSATMGEKFWVRMWHTWGVSLAVALLAYLSADLFRMTVEPFFGEGRIGYIALWTLDNSIKSLSWGWILSWITLVLPIHAFCLLCGCLFRKYTLRLTLFFVVIVGMMKFFIATLIAEVFYAHSEEKSLLIWVYPIFSYAVAFTLYFIAYRRFTSQ